MDSESAFAESYRHVIGQCAHATNASNASWTDLVLPYLCVPITTFWHGLPTHVLVLEEYPGLRMDNFLFLNLEKYPLFYIGNLVSVMVLGLFVYLHVYHGYVQRILSRLSEKLFGVAKPVLAFIFAQVCGVIADGMFVPVTIALSAVSTRGKDVGR